MPKSAEDRRDEAIALVLAAGGVVLGADPLADPTDPGVIVAYSLRLSAPDPRVAVALAGIQSETEIDTDGLVPWVDPAVELVGGEVVWVDPAEETPDA